MDERHLWFISKLSLTFQSTIHSILIENFVAKDETLETLNIFFQEGGNRTLFFYTKKPCDKIQNPEECELEVSIGEWENQIPIQESFFGLFFLKINNIEITINNIELELICSEIKKSVVASFCDIMKNAMCPLISSNKDWGGLDQEDIVSYINDVSKYADTLVEFTKGTEIQEEILKIPKENSLVNFRKNRQASLNPSVILEYEVIVIEWIQAIESILFDDTSENEQTIYTLPQGMLNKWQKRLKTVHSVIDQLKLKQAKTVIAILITAKAKLIKKWRIIDAGLTDVFNDVKDKVKFLESLKRFFNSNAQNISLEYLLNNFLPDLFSTIRHMDSVSRYYAKTGFLGSLFAKFSYQIAHQCYLHLESYLQSKSTARTLWKEMLEEILHGELKTEKVRLRKKIKNSSTYELMNILFTILSIVGQYCDMFHTLKDNYGSYSQQPITVVQVLSKRIKQLNNSSSESTTQSSIVDKANDSEYSLHTAHNSIVEGIMFKEDKVILHPIKTFQLRIHQLVDIIETIKQFNVLLSSAQCIPLLVVKEPSVDLSDSCSNDEVEEVLRLLESINIDRSFTTRSFSKELSMKLASLKTFLERELTLTTFYHPEQAQGNKFDDVYTQYVKTVRECEAMVEKYIKGVFDMKWSTSKLLEIMSSFYPVQHRTPMQDIFKEKYNKLLTMFHNDLEEVENMYNSQKDHPPLIRNLPVTSSSIYWSRNLYNKIESSMKMLSAVKVVTELKRYTSVVKIYNKLATVLLCYEENWIAFWRSHTEQFIPKLLESTLLAHDITENKLFVYANPRMLEVFSDVRALKRLKVTIPPSVSVVCSQEMKFKYYKETLEFYVKKYYELCESTPDHFATILRPLQEATLAYFQPGLSVLKWDSVNVDGFLHKAEQAIDKFESIITKVNSIVKEQIESTMIKLTELVLFDEATICSKVWQVSEFMSEMLQSMAKIGNHLGRQVMTIEKSLKEIMMTMTRGIDSPAPTSKATSPISFSDERKVANYLFSFYATKIYKVVLKCVNNSLLMFLQCCSHKSSGNQLKFFVKVTFALPSIVLSPGLQEVQQAISTAAEEMIEVTVNIKWWDEKVERTFLQAIHDDMEIKEVKEKINMVVQGLENNVSRSVCVFNQFNFLWLDDMNSLYKTFEEEKPDTSTQHDEVKRLLNIEEKINDIPNEIFVQSIVLDSSPIKDSLLGFCVAWKMCYVHNLHNVGQNLLKDIVTQREEYFSHLNGQIDTLEQLNNVLVEAEHILDLDNRIDELYLPVEILYRTLTHDYSIPLPREELNTVACLREKWKELLILAEKVTKKLIQEQRSVFEQELDKQVKEFVVAVIQFRNRFDSQGPGIPGIVPDEAVSRLKDFQEGYKLFEEKKNILHAVQKQYGIMPTPFYELEKTGKELGLLGMLYEIYQRFLKFDEKFRGTVWADVNLGDSSSQVNMIYTQCTSLPTSIHSWFAYKKLKESITDYREIFPILNRLASKEIRNRHWLQVMHVTKRSFQLEANIFKLHNILDIGLKQHQEEIEKILVSGKAELELEIKLRHIEEEWAEQIVKFQSFKNRGFVIFDKHHMNHILDSLEDSKTTLSSMLTSRHVKPLREEAAACSLKLNEVSEVLEEWLTVEELWINLEAIFSYENTTKELPEQSNAFAKADRSYMKLMKKTADSANVLQCCLGGEISKIIILKQIFRELETCFLSLSSYLDNKRMIFPRFHFVSDEILLSMLCKRHSIESVTPYVREVMNGVSKIETLTENASSAAPTPISDILPMERLGVEVPTKQLARKKFSISLSQRDRFSMQSNFENNRGSQRGSYFDYLTTSAESDSIKTPDTSITSVVDAHGEKLILRKELLLDGQVEVWLKQLLSSTKHAVYEETKECIQNLKEGTTIEDAVKKYPCQVVLMGFFYYWTKECEKAIKEIRNDRKAFISLNKKFSTIMNRFTLILSRGTYKSHLSLTNVQKLRLQCIISFCLYASDTIERVISNKIRDLADYDWQQTLRCYVGNFKSTDDNDDFRINENKHENKEINSNNNNESKVDNFRLSIKILDHQFSYRNEFLGCDLRSVMTMSSEKAMLNMMIALKQHTTGCISGDLLVGKSVLIKCLAILFGEHCVTVDCVSPLSLNSIQHVFLGAASDGSWCLFRDFHALTRQHLRIMEYCITTIHRALKFKTRKLEIDGFSPVIVQPNCGIFVTTSLSFIHYKCPASLKYNMRNVSVNQPDIMTILKIYLVANGFKAYKSLAYNIKLVVEIAKEQMKSNWNFGVSTLHTVIKRAAKKHELFVPTEKPPDTFVPKLPTVVSSVNTFSQICKNIGMGTQQTSKGIPAVMSETFKLEFSLIANSMMEIVDARLSDDESLLFKNIVRNVFGSHMENFLPISVPEEVMLEGIVRAVLEEKSCSAHKTFVDKIIQLYQLSQAYRGIVVCGHSQSGKSTIVTTLVESLRQLESQMSKENSLSYKQEHINVLAVSSLKQMFGHVNEDKGWVNGVFSLLMKRANQQLVMHKLSTWITLDGPLHEGWCCYLESLLSESKVFVQPDLKRHFLNEHVKILFETDSLSEASPSVAHMGILCVDNSVLGWRSIADAWLATQKSSYFHTLQRAFHKTVDRVLQFIQDEAQCCVNLSECALFSSCLNMLSSLLTEHADSLAGDLHIERLFLFSVIWMFGGLLIHENERREFNIILLSLSNALPDDDREISVFDYYVDESGEWDAWSSRLSDFNITETVDSFGGIFLETISTYRMKLLITQYMETGSHVILVGPQGTGKTSVIKNLLKNTTKKNETTKCITFTHSTDASFLQHFIENNVHHRQGFIYGAKKNKNLKLFIDDVHLPSFDQCNKQSVNQLLRQLLDQNVIFSVNKKCKPKYIEGLHVLAAMNSNSTLCRDKRNEVQRLMGKFGVLYMPPPDEKQLFSMTSSLLEANMTQHQGLSLPVHLHDLISKISVRLVSMVSKELMIFCTKPPLHYVFNIGDIATVFRMLQRCPEESRADDDGEYLTSHWFYEVQRTFADRIASDDDTRVFRESLQTHVKECIADSNIELDESVFTTFTSDSHLRIHRPVITYKAGRKLINHQKISSISSLSQCVDAYVHAYSNDKGEEIGVVWHDFNKMQLIKCHRILSQECRGNMIIVSSSPHQMNDIVKLAAFMLSHQYVRMDCSNKVNFMKLLRMAVRTAGCDNKHVTMCLQASEISDLNLMDSVSSIISLGEYTPLFSDTEMHGLLVALRPKIKKTHPNYMGDSRQFFTKSVQRNLHVVIFTSPNHSFMEKLEKMYPAILFNSHINYIPKNARQCLQEEIQVALNNALFWNSYDQQTKSKVLKVIEEIHLIFVSAHENETARGMIKRPMGVVERKLLHEVRRSCHQKDTVDVLTLNKFLNAFLFIMNDKVEQFQGKANSRSALSSLSVGEKRLMEMQAMKEGMENEYNNIEYKASSLLDELFQKSSLIERLKAKLHVGNGNFRAFMSLIDNEMMEGEEEFSWEEEHDELDEEYDRIQSSSQQRMKSLTDKISETQTQLERQQREMQNAKESLESYQLKIDRACIEKLRAYQSPPTLVGTIMVVLMILLRRPEFSHYIIKENKIDKRSENSISEGGTRNTALDTPTRCGSAKSRTAKETRTYGIGSDGRVDRATWKTIQLIMQDSQKFCEYMNTYNWFQGVPNDVLHTVVQFFAPGEEVPSTGKLQSTASSQRDERSNGISLQAARYSSEDAAQIVEYIQLVVQFTRKYKPYTRTLDNLKALKMEREEEEENARKKKEKCEEEEQKIEEKDEDLLEDLTEEDLSRLQDELSSLEEEFDHCIIKKHKMKEQIQDFKSLSDSTVQAIERLEDLKEEWQKSCVRFSTNESLLVNVISSSAFLSYCGNMDADERKTSMRKVISACQRNGLTCKNEAVFHQLPLVSFLCKKEEEKELAANHLPSISACTELACFLKLKECSNGWPLLCDPHQLSVFLVQKIFPQITVLHYDNFDNEIEEALVRGSQILVTNVNMSKLHSSSKLKRVIEYYHLFKNKFTIKLIIGQKEVECSPNFSMVLATQADCEEVPQIDHLNKLSVLMSRDMLFEIFLNFFVLKEKSQLNDTITKINEEILKQMRLMDDLEGELLSSLSQKYCFDDIVSIQKILSIKKQFDEASLSKKRADEALQSIETSEAMYAPIAQQAAVLFFVDATMRKINNIYKISIQRFLDYFAIAIKHSDRVAVTVTVERVLAAMFHLLLKAKLEIDRPLFALTVAVETQDVHGQVFIGDREFLIDSRLGATIKQYYAEYVNNQPVVPKSTIKKPFDWMSDLQYQHLSLLAQNCDWFSETFDKMAKDGREMQWRQISEHDTPEILPFPDNLDDRYSPLQKFLVIKSFRPDRFMQSAEIFITTTLGKKFACDPVLDLKSISQQSPASVPILLLYEKDSILGKSLLSELAETKEIRLIVFTVSGQKIEEDFLKEALMKCMLHGNWFLLKEIHHNIDLVLKVLSFMKKQKCDSSFRMWLLADMTSSGDLIERFHNCTPIIIDMPKLNLQTSFVQSFHMIEQRTWNASIQNDWVPSLHNMCMLHSSLLQRWRSGAVHHFHSFNFDFLKIFETLYLVETIIDKEIRRQSTSTQHNVSLKNLPWPAIKLLIHKIVYGREVSSWIDSQILFSIIDYWMSTNATRKDFGVARAHYKLPAAVLSNSPKVGNILQAVDALPASIFTSTEFCGLFQTLEATLASSSYCINKFKEMVDLLPESNSILHPDPSVALEKDMDLLLLYPANSKNVYVNTYTMMMQFRKIDILETINNVLTKLPKLWSKDFVLERIRRTGGVNAFNMWLLSEADQISLLHHVIKSTLMQAKEFLEKSKSMAVNDKVISVLNDLYNGRIPDEWMKHAGPSAPPSSWTFLTWIADLQNRCSHIEKIIVQGREKMAGYWLAAFFYPKRLISAVMQESTQLYQLSISRGERLVLKTELTTRDKDHLRDPPSEGIFIYGVSLWGTSWEKATNELHDVPPKSSYYSLPVLHVQFVPTVGRPVNFPCPCFVSRATKDEEILNVDIEQKDVNSLRWFFRGLYCTLRPF